MMNARAFIVMMSKKRAKTLLRLLAVVFWVLLWTKAYLWMRDTGLGWRELPQVLRHLVRQAGVWGPLAVLLAYVARTFLLVPSCVLEIVAGSLFGPVIGTLLNVLGANLSAALAFAIGRLLGRDFLSHHEHGRLKMYDEALSRDGFSVVLAMRLVMVPFDIVNYLSGMTGIKFLDYALATALGSLPAILAFTIVGDHIGKPKGLLVFLGLAAAVVVFVLLLRRHPWARAKLFHMRAKPHE